MDCRFTCNHSQVFCTTSLRSLALVSACDDERLLHGSQVTEEVAAHLKDGGVAVKPYEAMLDDVRTLASSGLKLWTDPAKVSMQTTQT